MVGYSWRYGKVGKDIKTSQKLLGFIPELHLFQKQKVKIFYVKTLPEV